MPELYALRVQYGEGGHNQKKEKEMSQIRINIYQAIGIIFLLILLPLLFYQTSFGQSCPPCTAEQNALQQAQQQVALAEADKNSKDTLFSNACDEKVEACSNAYLPAVIAMFAVGGACASGDGDDSSNATVLCLEASHALQKCTDAKGKVTVTMKDAIEAGQALGQKQAAYNTAKQALDDCLARVAPVCKKCQAGTIVNDDSQDPGMCQKCEGGSAANDDSESCDDGDSCTHNDYCSDGGCTGEREISPILPCP